MTYVARVKLEVIDRRGDGTTSFRNSFYESPLTEQCTEPEVPEEENDSGTLSRAAQWVGGQIRRISTSSKSSR